MRKTLGPVTIAVHEIEPGNALTAYRIVRSDVREDPAFLDSLRSNYELDREPRKVERSSTVIYMGISAFIDVEMARYMAQRWTKLGDYIATLRLVPGHGFDVAATGHPLHLTIWGDPVKLRDVTTDVHPVWN